MPASLQHSAIDKRGSQREGLAIYMCLFTVGGCQDL